jgi:hypothetical protein
MKRVLLVLLIVATSAVVCSRQTLADHWRHGGRGTSLSFSIGSGYGSGFNVGYSRGYGQFGGGGYPRHGHGYSGGHGYPVYPSARTYGYIPVYPVYPSYVYGGGYHHHHCH